MSLITEQIKRLRSEAAGMVLQNGTTARLLREAADTISVLSEKLQAANMERSSAYYNGGWIPVKERLPENSGVYIVTREFTDGFECADLTDACYFDGTSTWHNDNRINHGREYVNKKIKAWMPLPEPYREDGDTE